MLRSNVNVNIKECVYISKQITYNRVRAEEMSIVVTVVIITQNYNVVDSKMAVEQVEAALTVSVPN